MVTISNEDFIRVYEKAFSDEFCDNLVQYFEWCLENNMVWERGDSALNKKDHSVLINPHTTEINYNYSHINWLIGDFNSLFWDQYYKEYCEEFPVLNNFGGHTIFSYKLQKTFPGGGYHVWHAEQDSKNHADRLAVYTVYLNDIFEGGETEFLHQRIRVPARKGSLCIFPASYSHAHRGNPPLNEIKYILTGWVEFRG